MRQRPGKAPGAPADSGGVCGGRPLSLAVAGENLMFIQICADEPPLSARQLESAKVCNAAMQRRVVRRCALYGESCNTCERRRAPLSIRSQLSTSNYCTHTESARRSHRPAAPTGAENSEWHRFAWPQQSGWTVPCMPRRRSKKHPGHSLDLSTRKSR